MRRWATGFLLTSALATSGCAAYHYSTCTVRLTDAATGAPVEGANVSVGYNQFPLGPVSPPQSDSGVTDDQGRVTLKATADRSKQISPTLLVKASNYSPPTVEGQAEWWRFVNVILENPGVTYDKDVVVPLPRKEGSQAEASR